MPLIDVSLLFTPISLMICMTSFPGTWVESLIDALQRMAWAVRDGWVLQSLQRGTDCRLQAPLQAGVSRTRDTEGHCHALAPPAQENDWHREREIFRLTTRLADIKRPIFILHIFNQIDNVKSVIIFNSVVLVIHPWIPPSVHRKERGPGLRAEQTRGVSPVSSGDWPGQWGPVWAVSAVSLPPWPYSLRLNQDNPANCKTGMRFKYTYRQMVIVKPGLVSNSRSQYWYRDRATHSETHGPGSRRLLLLSAKIMHEGLASETKRQASARETNVNWVNLSHSTIDLRQRM